MLGRDDSREVNRFSAVSDLVCAGEGDDSREVNRFSAVSDLVSAGEG